MLATLIWGSADWLWPAALFAALGLAAILWSYRRAPSSPRVRVIAGGLKLLGLGALALCLVEPLRQESRARPGANLFVLLADTSRSLEVRDRGETRSRGELLRETLDPASGWQARLGRDFEVRRYGFDARVREVADFTGLQFSGRSTALAGALRSIAERFRERPLAGILLFTDGNATDLPAGDPDWTGLPPTYPVVVGDDGPVRDLGVSQVVVSQTNFEATPVQLRAEIAAHGFAGEEVVARLHDEGGKLLAEETALVAGDGKPLALRFEVKPEPAGSRDERGAKAAGIGFYRLSVRRRVEGEGEETQEATLANNQRLVVVDRGGGPYRVLYVAGRPNWEFKFLRRSLEEDREVELVGLLRIARGEPRFEYRGRAGESANPLFQGFGKEGDEETERYDQPVLVRLGTRDAEELRAGFPKTAEELYAYHGVIIDDLEAGFFTHDQLGLLQKFVSQRGGGLLMLGGQECFARGQYARTPLADVLPVYLDAPPAVHPGAGFRLSLSREGWLEPWVRLRRTEEEERERLAHMPAFAVLNPVEGIKPGAAVLAAATDGEGHTAPALVAQRYGKGRAAALLIGDLWRWSLRRESPEVKDMERAWRQTVRWLVADVPQRVEVKLQAPQAAPPAHPDGDAAAGEHAEAAVRLEARVLDPGYQPLDNAAVSVRVVPPDGKALELTAEPGDEEAGVYAATYVPGQPGAYRFQVKAAGPDGAAAGEREAGWCAGGEGEEELRVLRPDRARLERLARATGGEVVRAERLAEFAASLPSRQVPIAEVALHPLWHQWPVFLFAILCLAGEWALRRSRGLP
jgi:uncharacterized membrane protein